MKKSTLVLKIFLLCVAVLLLTVDVFVVIANVNNDTSAPTESLSQWMSYVRDESLLKRVVIPGAHDAGTAGISYLAQTQDRTTEQLLACGTRYFDLRVSAAETELKIYHGPFRGMTLASVLNAFKTFLQQHPSETLILDFQHFENNAERATLQEFCAVFDDSTLLVKNNSTESDVNFVDNLTLGECRGKALVVWGRDVSEISADFVFQRNNDGGDRENSVLHSYYQGSLNKKSSSYYVENALPHYLDLYKAQNSGLFVLQGQLTDGLFVFGPHFRESTHTKNMNAYVLALENSVDLQFVNVIMRDFVSPAKNCLALRLNKTKGFVKTESLSAFEKMIEENLK